MQHDDWPLVEMALLLIGQTHTSFGKTSFDPLGRDKSSFRLPIQFHLTFWLHKHIFMPQK
jgi:hypothetical protein